MKLVRCIVLTITVFTCLWAIWDVRFNTIGQWDVAFSNFGKFGQKVNGDAGAFWPRGTQRNYIYGAGVWIGGILPNGDTVVTVGYEPHTGASECSPGLPYTSPYDPQWHVYFSTDPDYPFTPISYEDGYAICNDFDTINHIPDSFHVKQPLGIKMTLKTFTWPIVWADDVVFIQFTIKNDTTYSMNEVYAGICLDFDIGNEAAPNANDRCGIDLSRKLFYGWQEEPEGGWPVLPGMIGLKMLSSHPLAAFKQFTLQYEPEWDRERYLTLAGYDYETGLYEPFDTIWPSPDDQRILMSVGPINSFAPGDSISFDWALIYGADQMPPSPDLEDKADRAQAFYDIGALHDVTVIEPNGSESVTGTFLIEYSATSVTGNPLLVDILLESEHGEDTIATGVPNTGIYEWQSDLSADCVLGKMIIFAYDSITFGYDESDDYFTIDNPGNAPPYLDVYTPDSLDTLAGQYDITWFARDAEFHDSLTIDIAFKSQYDTAFHQIASDEPNDSIFTWITWPYRNGTGVLIIETHDEEFSVAETIQVYLFNQVVGDTMEHISGINNCIDLSCFVHHQAQLTGHTYELRFLQYRLIVEDIGGMDCYCPEYIYEIIDSNTGAAVLDTYSLADGYDFGVNLININDFSPIIDGFSVWSHTESMYTINRGNFMFDSVQVVLGDYPEDMFWLEYNLARTWWAYRGSRLQLDWVTHTNGGLTLFVTDLDYGDTIPYKPYGRTLNPDSAYGWCFHGNMGMLTPPSDTLLYSGTHGFLLLCGALVRFRVDSVLPEVGDRWIVYPSQYSPPIEGNIYRFLPYLGISEHAKGKTPIRFAVFPVPSTNTLTVSYSIPQKERVQLVVYDILGRKVKTLVDGTMEAGAHTITWRGRDDRNRKVATGVYFCRFEVGEHMETTKFVMLR